MDDCAGGGVLVRAPPGGMGETGFESVRRLQVT
jgi:hypothetical protein